MAYSGNVELGKEATFNLIMKTDYVREWIEREREAAHGQGETVGAIEIIDWAIREVQERLAAAERYDDTRPYTELLTLFADKRRGLTG